MIFTLLAITLESQAVPLQLTQQGRMVDSAGAPVSGPYIVTYRIYDDVSGGNLLWTEGLTVNFTNGYYASVLGADTVTNPLDSSILSLYPIYLEVQLGPNTPMSPRTAVNSSPYSQIAGIAESVEGGSVDASNISISGSPVIDGNGLWVGQPITVDWSNVVNVPGDIADGDANTQLSETQVEGYVNNGAIDLHPSTTMNGSGLLTQADTLTPDWTNVTNRPSGLDDGDDDALAGLGCGPGEIVGWDGLNWVCTSDNTLTETEVENFVTNGAIDLDAASTIGGQDIMTSDDDTLAGLSCLDTEIARWDAVAGEWYCAQDTMGTLNCSNGEVASYDGTQGTWVCTDIQTLFDGDGDGVATWADCDDGDANIGSSVLDNDCDGLMTSDDCDDFDVNANAVADDNDCDGALTADDCDDNNPNSTFIATDADCDGYTTIQDCNDNDPNSTILATDADCDGTVTADDCNDNDANSTLVADDGDCDGTLTADDCDDTDPNVTTQIGSLGCPAQSCNEILADDPNSTDGAYYLDPDNLGTIQVYCDMTLDDGGWTLVYINDQSNPLDTNNISQQGNVSELTSPTGDSAKLADTYINAIRGNSDLRAGYRVTSNNISNRYFSPSTCSYAHTQNGSSECRKYISSYDSSTNPNYKQCQDWGGGSGGLDAWYTCSGSWQYTNVFNTHRTYSQTSGITTNSSGNGMGSSSTQYSNDVLMWVR